jgi:hypothetical protein
MRRVFEYMLAVALGLIPLAGVLLFSMGATGPPADRAFFSALLASPAFRERLARGFFTSHVALPSVRAHLSTAAAVEEQLRAEAETTLKELGLRGYIRSTWTYDPRASWASGGPIEINTYVELPRK